MHFNPYLLGLASNLLFAFASIIFTRYAFKFSPFLVSAFKSFCALILFSLCLPFISHQASLMAIVWLSLSGLVGFNFSDILLTKGFTYLGPSRTLVLFSFHPLIVGLASSVLFNQAFPAKNFLALGLMAWALFMFISERKSITGRWEFKSFLIAFAGVLLDALGVLLSRYAFSVTPSINSFECSFYRAMGASVGFLIMIGTNTTPFLQLIKKATSSDFLKLSSACFFGTFISSILYLSALPNARLAILSSLSISGPLITALGECLWHRKAPSFHLICAFILFSIGLAVMSVQF